MSSDSESSSDEWTKVPSSTDNTSEVPPNIPDVDQLIDAVRILTDKVNKMQENIDEITRKCDEKIAEITRKCDEKIAEITRKCDERIAELESDFANRRRSDDSITREGMISATSVGITGCVISGAGVVARIAGSRYSLSALASLGPGGVIAGVIVIIVAGLFSTTTEQDAEPSAKNTAVQKKRPSLLLSPLQNRA